MRKRTFSRALRIIQAAIVSSILGLFLFLAFRFSFPTIFYFLIGFFSLFTSNPTTEWFNKGYLIGIQLGRFSGIIAGALLTFYTFRKLILLPFAWLHLATVIAVTSACHTWLNTLGPYMLETAIQERNLKQVELLLKLGGDVEKGYHRGNLKSAVLSGNGNIVLLLLAKGAKADQDSLSAAIISGRKDFVLLLLAKGAKADQDSLSAAIRSGRKDFVLLLLAKGAKADQDSLRLAIVELLIAKGDANQYGDASRYYETPLQKAVYFQRREIVDLLLAKGADVNSVDRDGKTLLQQAMLGAEVARPGYSETPLQKAIRLDMSDLVLLLIAKGAKADQDSLSAAIKLQNKDLVELLLAKGANVNGVDQGGDTPLLHAVASTFSSETREIVKLLLAKGANVNSVNRDGETPLRKAIRLNRSDIVQLLFAKGADAKGLALDERLRLDEHLRAIFDRR